MATTESIPEKWLLSEIALKNRIVNGRDRVSVRPAMFPPASG
jgi:hypothetical protein